MSGSDRPNRSRKRHQAALRRRRRHRRARIRRLRALRALVGLQFWTRAAVVLAIGVLVAFWAKFAFVYDIPDSLDSGTLAGVAAYVTVKPWWFGPPAFDLGETVQTVGDPYMTPLDALFQGLGRYAGVVEHPVFVWVLSR